MNAAMDAHGDTFIPGACPPDPIFVLGAPRSGTTWLAKILDSHPDVVYRHEPDDILPPPDDPSQTDVAAIVAAWCADTCLRTAGKRPFFSKSWQSPLAGRIRTGIAYGMAVASRLPHMREAARRWPLPDLGDISRARPVIKSVRWCDGIGLAARHLPRSRTVVILRRPRGQVFSVMRGARQKRFELRLDGALPMHERRATDRAARSGVDRSAFATLPDSAKYAWDWVAFNEAIERGVAGLTNVMTVRYEDLSERPEQVARRIMEFVGLDWSPQTEAFVHASSTSESDGAYYSVVQRTADVANRWRSEMADADQRAVVAVARLSSLARHWPDLLVEDT